MKAEETVVAQISEMEIASILCFIVVELCKRRGVVMNTFLIDYFRFLL
jgi:hypothetical protein